MADGTLTCRACGVEKRLRHFRMAREVRTNFCHACYAKARNQEKKIAADRAWRKRNPDAIPTIRQRYGMVNDGRDIPEQKYCITCQRTVSGDSFYRNRTTPDGLDTYCISCRKAYIEDRKHGD